MKRNYSNSSGFTLVEVLVAMSIFAVVSAIMAPSFLYQLKVNYKAELKNGAISVTQQVLDSLRPTEISSLPTTGSSTQNISAGDRTYSVKTTYCKNTNWCGTSSRHLNLDVYYRNERIYGTETVFSQLR
jgi:prepilin-type N-terminal cleavage/methylation domain-containing protein